MKTPDTDRAPRGLDRLFGDLKVRPKLIVLHNTFFLILTCSVYFTLIPLFKERMASAQAREVALLTRLFEDNAPMPHSKDVEVYEFGEGTAADLEIPASVREWLDRSPGQVWRDGSSQYAYRMAGPGLYRRMRTPHHLYADMIDQAQRTLFLVLGVIYGLAVLLLEFVIMPQYVYRPLTMMLRADRAAQDGDRDRELIRDENILDDEIGQIMRSRNATVRDLRHKNELLERAKKNLEDQDRLASIGMLSASVAHEVNTPLTVLHGSIEKLLEKANDDATRERLERMLRVTQRLRRIGESLVDFARVRRETVEPVPLRPIVDEAWGLLAIDDKASAAYFVNGVAAEHKVIGNTDRLTQVFVNLLRNSLNAIHTGGHIVVGSTSVDENGRTWIVTTVEDDGPGIPAAVLPDIFDAFVTTRLDAKGTGLGLTVSEGIVRQHGGSIAASNRPGGGAKLEVKLPAALKTADLTHA